MSRRRRPGAWKLLRSMLGFALAPSAVAVVFSAATALTKLSGGNGEANTFLGAFAGYGILHALRIFTFQRLYVFAHESTHALAAWSTGGKVFSFVIREGSGHVDLSHSSIFIALAPYWIPLYSLWTIAVYRVVVWSGPPSHSREMFLALMGATISFHIAHTLEALWTTHQSDLDEAGFPLSMSLIVFLNGSLILGALKCLFPRLVSLADCAHQIAAITSLFWTAAASLLQRGGQAFL